jgi:cell division protein FtsA
MRKRGELIVGLDVGTTKTCVVIGEGHHITGLDGRPYMVEVGDIGVDIIGTGIVPSRGIKKGVVVNMEEAVESIKDAIREAESTSGVSIKAVYAGIKGRHIDYINSHGVIAVRGGEVTQEDVDSVIDSAKAVAIPFDRKILHVVPTGFTINGQNGIHDPRGMEGVRLEAGVRIITADAMSVHNLTKACQKAGIEVIDVVFEPFATAMTLLDSDEREMGVALVDVGGGTTDIAVFVEGNLCHTSILPVGGINFTNDISIGLRTSIKYAEEIKKRYGLSMLSMVKEDDEIEVGYSDERYSRMLPRRYLIEIIQPRAEELWNLVVEDLRKSGFYGMLASGVVITGGGALLGGTDIMAENILELPVRTGLFRAEGDMPGPLNSPAFTSSVGLVLYGAGEIIKVARNSNDRLFRGMMARLRGWTGEIFRF